MPFVIYYLKHYRHVMFKQVFYSEQCKTDISQFIHVCLHKFGFWQEFFQQFYRVLSSRPHTLSMVDNDSGTVLSDT